MLIHLLNQMKTIAQHVVTHVQDRLKQWTQPLKDTLVGGTVSDVVKGKPELIAENALLRQQLIVVKRQIKQPQLKGRDRLLLVLLASKVRTWRQVLLLVKPETVRSGIENCFAWSGNSTQRSKITSHAWLLKRLPWLN